MFCEGILSKVCLQKCEEYDYALVKEKLDAAIDSLGGIGRFVKPGMKVLVKPNLVRKGQPEQHMTTHPCVVRAVAEAVISAGASALIAESPGGIYAKPALKMLYDATGMTEAAIASGAELNYDCSVHDVYFPEGEILKELKVIKPLMDCDAVITVGKLKTHEMMAFTGAAKNLFGVVPGLTKTEYHYRMPGQNDFANMLVDVVEYAKPVLSVIDAVWGMEGDGPCSGDPRKIGALIVSDNAYSADIAALKIVGIEPADVPLIKNALIRNLTPDFRHIEFLGDGIKAFMIGDFKKPAKLTMTLLEHRIPEFLLKPLERLFVLRPVALRKKCIGCGICEKYCPPGAIKVNDWPTFNYTECINCFCCHELCPQKAIRVKRPVIFRILTRLFK
jgi:uncharacterized protein (DUF362 family)/Pyruvate/2-oxoacid:ferredoxin oxidoreductase delta subunit